MRAGFRAVLEATGEMEVVGEAGDGEEAVALARRAAPGRVLMDIRMPLLDGIEATRRLAGHRVLILTTFGLDDYIIEALRAGASGFILKDVPTAELVHAVRVIAAGDALLSPAVTRRLLDRVGRRLPASATTAPGALAELTEREREVFELLARGLSNAEIAEAAHGRRRDGQDARLQRADEARPARPRAGGRARLRERPDRARRLRLTAEAPAADPPRAGAR